MHTTRTIPAAYPRLVASASALALAVIPASAWAQASAAPGPTVDTGPGGGGGALTLIVLLAALGAIIVAAVKGIDLKRRREMEGVRIQAKISDALLLDSRLAMLPVAVTARVPFWSGRPVTIEVRGHVDWPQQHEAAIDFIRRELAEAQVDYLLDDRISVKESTAVHA